MEFTGAQVIVEELKAQGVEVVFGIPGGATIPLYDALFDSPIKHVLTRHEQGAAHAADGYARVSGRPGVVITTSGPGATNIVTGLANACMDSVPLVAITGQVPTGLIGNDSFQEADIYGISVPITKYNYLVKNIGRLTSVMREAFHIATTGRPGPVLIDIPRDIQVMKCPYPPQEEWKPMEKASSAEGGIEESLSQISEAIRTSERPVIMAGGGVIKSGGAKELKELAIRVNIPVTCTLQGLGAFPGTHPLFLGMPGMHGTRYANKALSEADLILAFGMRFDDRVTGALEKFAPKARVVHVDIDAAEIGKRVRVDVPVVGDVREALLLILKRLRGRKRPRWLKRIEEWKRSYPLNYDREGDSIKPQYVIEQLYEATGGRAIIATGVGQHQMWVAQYHKFDEPHTFVSSGGLGTMGFGFPAALGAQMARPDRTVAVVDGDGSFQMNIQELATVAQYKIPVKVVILNNGFLGMVRQWQQFFYNKRYSQTRFEVDIDFTTIAKGYGIAARRVEREEEVRGALEEALASSGPYLLDFRIAPEENVLPMVPAGAGIDESLEEGS